VLALAFLSNFIFGIYSVGTFPIECTRDHMPTCEIRSVRKVSSWLDTHLEYEVWLTDIERSLADANGLLWSPPAGAGCRPFSIWRRYSQFNSVHVSLQRQGVAVAQLPPKTNTRHGTSPQLASERKSALEGWLNEHMNARLGPRPQLLEFLGYEEGHRVGHLRLGITAAGFRDWCREAGFPLFGFMPMSDPYEERDETSDASDNYKSTYQRSEWIEDPESLLSDKLPGPSKWITDCYGEPDEKDAETGKLTRSRGNLRGYDLCEHAKAWLSLYATERDADGRPLQSVCEVLLARGSREVRSANAFYSHLQSKRPRRTLECMELAASTYYEELGVASADDVCFWLDYLVLRQCQKDFHLVQVQTTISHIGATVVELDDTPREYLGRSFCIFELYSTVHSGGLLMPCVSLVQAMRMKRTLEERPVDCKAAQTRSQADKLAIDSFIESSVNGGFAGLDEIITGSMLEGADKIAERTRRMQAISLSEYELGDGDWNAIAAILDSDVTVTSLNLAGNMFTMLRADVLLLQTPKLQALHLGRCRHLTSLSDLSVLTALQTLDLNNCAQLQSLPDLSALAQLQTLDLNNCAQLRSLPDLSALVQLQTLDLTNCAQLQSLPDLSALAQLQTLSLADCGKAGIGLADSDEEDSDDEEEADLHENQRSAPGTEALCHLIPGFSALTQLRALNLKNFWVPGLGLAHLAHLRALNLAAMGQLPDELPAWPQLQTLRLGDGRYAKQLLGRLDDWLRPFLRLTALPDLSACTQLQSLELYDCQALSSLPDLSALKSLQTLRVKACPLLSCLPDLSGLTQLQTLGVAGLALTSLPDLSALTQLRKLHVRSCRQLESLPDLSALVRLEAVWVVFCRRLPDSAYTFNFSPQCPLARSIHLFEEAFERVDGDRFDRSALVKFSPDAYEFGFHRREAAARRIAADERLEDQFRLEGRLPLGGQAFSLLDGRRTSDTLHS
jgi:Leucine-rich repeat (LRR) protein